MGGGAWCGVGCGATWCGVGWGTMGWSKLGCAPALQGSCEFLELPGEFWGSTTLHATPLHPTTLSTSLHSRHSAPPPLLHLIPFKLLGSVGGSVSRTLDGMWEEPSGSTPGDPTWSPVDLRQRRLKAPEDPLRALGPEGHLKALGLVDQIFDRIDLALLGLPEGAPWPEGLWKTPEGALAAHGTGGSRRTL